MKCVKTVLGDITKIPSDAIVNAANHTLLMGSGVCGAIHQVAGPELETECLKLGGCEIGRAKTTKAYGLPAKYVIHACGPNYYQEKNENARKLLISTYNSLLDEADKHKNIKMITVPAISCGIYGFPLNDAAQIALKTIKNWRSKTSGQSADERFDNIVFVLFENNIKAAFDNALKDNE